MGFEELNDFVGRRKVVGDSTVVNADPSVGVGKSGREEEEEEERERREEGHWDWGMGFAKW